MRERHSIFSRLDALGRFIDRFGAIEGTRLAFSLWTRNRAKPGTPIVVHVPGYATPVTLRAQTADVGVFRQTLINRQYDCADLDSPSLILDCGAHIGLATLYFARRYPTANIISVESNRDNYDLLRRNTAQYPRVRCLHGAIWGSRERVAVTNPNAETWAFRVAPSDDSGSLPGLTIEGLLEESGTDTIDLLKIDIEGAERAVFESDGARQWIRRTSVLMIELHDDISPGCSQALYELVRPYERTQRVQDEVVCLDFRRASANGSPSA